LENTFGHLSVDGNRGKGQFCIMKTPGDFARHNVFHFCSFLSLSLKSENCSRSQVTLASGNTSKIWSFKHVMN